MSAPPSSDHSEEAWIEQGRMYWEARGGFPNYAQSTPRHRSWRPWIFLGSSFILAVLALVNLWRSW